MGPFGIVEVHPVADGTIGLEAVGQVFQIDSFLLQQPPQSLDEDVVHAYPSLGQRGELRRSGGLRPLIGVHDLRRPEPGDGFFQCFDTEVGVHRV